MRVVHHSSRVSDPLQTRVNRSIAPPRNRVFSVLFAVIYLFLIGPGLTAFRRSSAEACITRPHHAYPQALPADPFSCSMTENSKWLQHGTSDGSLPVTTLPPSSPLFTFRRNLLLQLQTHQVLRVCLCILCILGRFLAAFSL